MKKKVRKCIALESSRVLQALSAAGASWRLAAVLIAAALLAVSVQAPAYNGTSHFAIVWTATRLLAEHYPSAYNALNAELSAGNNCAELRNMRFDYLRTCDILKLLREESTGTSLSQDLAELQFCCRHDYPAGLKCPRLPQDWLDDADLDAYVSAFVADLDNRLAVQAVAPDFYRDLWFFSDGTPFSAHSCTVDAGPFGRETVYISLTSLNHFIDLGRGLDDVSFDDNDGYSYGLGSGSSYPYETNAGCDKELGFWQSAFAPKCGLDTYESVDKNAADYYGNTYVAIDNDLSILRYSYPGDRGLYGSRETEAAARFPSEAAGGYTQSTFMPVDNMARYWFGRYQATLDPLCLGPVLHAIGDCSVPHHAAGVLGCGHAIYEAQIEDLLLAWLDDSTFISTVLSLVHQWNRYDDIPPDHQHDNDYGTPTPISGVPARNWPIEYLAEWLAGRAYSYFTEQLNSPRHRPTYNCHVWSTLDLGRARELVAQVTAMSVLVMLKATTPESVSGSVGSGACCVDRISGTCVNTTESDCSARGGKYYGNGSVCGSGYAGEDCVPMYPGTPFCGGCWYSLEAKCSGMCLDVNGGVSENGRNVQQWVRNGTDAQVWGFERAWGYPDNCYLIVNYGTSKYLTLDTGTGTGLQNGANVYVWDRTGYASQLWYVDVDGNGNLKIRSAFSMRCLDVVGASKNSGANVQQWECNASDAQAWAFRIEPSH